MEDTEKGFYKGSCMHFSLYIYYQCREMWQDRTVGTHNTRKGEKTVHTLVIENLKERDCCSLQLTPCRRVLFENLIVLHLYSSPNIVRVIKSRRMKWAGHVARMGEERGV